LKCGTNKRFFESADGVLPAPDQQQLALIGLLPPDISSNVIMEMEKPGFETFSAIKKYALKLVKVLQSQKRHRGALNLVDAYSGVEYEEGQQDAEDEGEVDTETAITEIMALGLAPDVQAAEINAFVTKKCVRRGPAEVLDPPRTARRCRSFPLEVCQRPCSATATRQSRCPVH